MDFKISFSSNDEIYSSQLAKSLHRWLNNEEDSNYTIKQERIVLKENEAGDGLFLNTLFIMMATPPIGLLMKSLHTWFKEKTKQQKVAKREIKLTITDKEGRSIDLEFKNPTNEESIQFQSLIQVFSEKIN